MVSTFSLLCRVYVMFLTYNLCVAQCGDPGDISDGTKSGTYNDGDMVTYSCNPGYILTGSATRTCTTTTWGGSAPSCTIQDCGALATPSNAQVASASGTAYGSSITHSCVAGFSNTGGIAQRNCQANGIWSGWDIVCTAVVSLGGDCTVDQSPACAASDANSECQTNMCACKTGYSDVSGTCTAADSGSYKFTSKTVMIIGSYSLLVVFVGA